MARNSRSEAIAKKKCRSIVGTQVSGNSQVHHSGKPVSRRQFAYHAALNTQLVAEHVTGGEW